MNEIKCEKCGLKYDGFFEQVEGSAGEVICPRCGHEFEVDLYIQGEMYLGVSDEE